MSFRLFAHAPAYYELGSFPNSGMKRALQNLERRQLVSGKDGDLQFKNRRGYLHDAQSHRTFAIPCFLELWCSLVLLVLFYPIAFAK
jgi:hypothetical protein